jgi:hypothetical protein
LEAFMAQISPTPSHKYSIADREAVGALLGKVTAPKGSHIVDEKKLLQALLCAARQYKNANQIINQAFFHGLLTGYAVGLKHK